MPLLSIQTTLFHENTRDGTPRGVGSARRPFLSHHTTPGCLLDFSCFQETKEGLNKKIV